MKTTEERLEALLNYLVENGEEITEDEISEGDEENSFELEDGREYLVLDSDEAYNKAVEWTQDLLDDAGFTVVDGWEQFVDEDWFEDAYRETEESYVNDIEYENDLTFESRLIEELVENDLLDEESDFHYAEDDVDKEYPLLNDDVDLEQKKAEYVETLLDNIRDYVEEYIFDFGKQGFEEVCKYYDLVNLYELAEYCVNSDGPAHTLSTYDGDELPLGNDLYAYRLD